MMAGTCEKLDFPNIKDDHAKMFKDTYISRVI